MAKVSVQNIERIIASPLQRLPLQGTNQVSENLLATKYKLHPRDTGSFIPSPI